MADMKQLIDDITIELEHAQAKFPPFHTPHEGYAVILEELDELWELCRVNRGRTLQAREEAIQIAAMAIRYVADLILPASENVE